MAVLRHVAVLGHARQETRDNVVVLGHTQMAVMRHAAVLRHAIQESIGRA